MLHIDLKGQRGLIVGVANAESLAWAAARQMRAAGAEIALTYPNDKARPHVEPLAREADALLLPCDVTRAGELPAVFDALRRHWGRLDFVLHSIASAPKEDLRAPLVDGSPEGFAQAMLVSCHSLVHMARLARPLMRAGGSLTTLSFYGAEKVVEHYGLMGPVKAALEASVRYLAHELGPSGIRVNAISAGPVRTRAASGIVHFDELLAEATRRSPMRRTVEADEVGNVALMLCSPYASGITGEVVHVDAGFHVEGMVFH